MITCTCFLYNFLDFHLPFLNSTNAAILMAVSATGMAMKTPVGPRFSINASMQANGI